MLRVAVYVLLLKGDEILLGRRFNTGWQDGNYGIPAGHLEPDETIIHGAVRELEEETGVKVNEEDFEYVHTMHRMNRYIDIFFATSNWIGEPKITEPDKCDDLRWFPINELPSNIVPSVKFAIENYQNGVKFSEFSNRE